MLNYAMTAILTLASAFALNTVSTITAQYCYLLYNYQHSM